MRFDFILITTYNFCTVFIIIATLSHAAIDCCMKSPSVNSCDYDRPSTNRFISILGDAFRTDFLFTLFGIKMIKEIIVR